MDILSIFKVKESFKDRTIGFWIGLAAAGLILIATVVTIILYSTGNLFFHPDDRDKVRMTWAFVFFFLGVVASGFMILTDLKFASFIPIVFYSLGIGMYFYLAMFPIADILTGVQFFGGNATSVLIFGIIFIVITIAAIVSCFMKQRKIQ